MLILSVITDIYFLPVVNYLFFNTGDYLGRLAAGWLDMPSNKNTCLLLTVMRVLFVPCLLCSNSGQHRFLPILVQHDYTFIALIVLFALSNGYLTNMLLIMAPRWDWGNLLFTTHFLSSFLFVVEPSSSMKRKLPRPLWLPPWVWAWPPDLCWVSPLCRCCDPALSPASSLVP